MFSFSKQPLESYSIFLSLTSSDVSVALVSTHTKTPQVILTSSEPLSLRKEMGTAAITASTQKAIHQALKKVTAPHQNIHTIHSIHCVLSSPWVITQAKTVLSTFETPKVINRSNIISIIDQEKNILRDSYSDIEFIEEKICLTKVNGYEVESITTTTAHNLEVSFIISTTATSVAHVVEKTVHEFFPKATLEYHSGLLLEYSTLTRLYPDIKDCVFVDVHGEITDIVALAGGVPRYTGSFPLGIREFTQVIARHLKVSTTIADSTLKLYTEGSHDATAADKIETAIVTTGGDWVQHFSTCMSEISENMIIPCKILVSADNHQSTFVTLIEKECKEGRLSNFCDIVEYSHDIFGDQIEFVPASRTDGRLAAYILGVRDLI